MWWMTVAQAGTLWDDLVHGGNSVAAVDLEELTLLLAPGDATTVAAGDAHSCAINGCGSITCWGDDQFGQVSGAPSYAEPWEQLSAGANHTCALSDDLKITCWGLDDAGQASPPSDQYRRVAAGDRFTCGTRLDRTIECWGDVPAGLPIRATDQGRIGAGDAHACSISRDRTTVTCGGDNGSGQADPPLQPTDLFLLAREIEGGDAHTCGIATGYLLCFGDDRYGQSSGIGGHPTLPGRWAVEVADAPGLWQFPGSDWVDVDAGGDHACAVNNGGDLYCWGRDDHGQADEPGGSYLAVATGQDHSCAIESDGDVKCFGRDDAGQASAPVLPKLCRLARWDLRWGFLVQDE